LIERAFVSDVVLLSVVKKFIPDKQHKEVEPPEDIHFYIVDATSDDDDQIEK
jgi:hypothetical protein